MAKILASSKQAAKLTNPLEKLALDHWYKVLMAGGFAVFLLTAAGALPILPSLPTLLISLGLFFFGLGEWRNHPLQTRLAGNIKITSYPRNASLIGNAFDFVGLLMIGFGLGRLFY